MTDREKLIALIKERPACPYVADLTTPCGECKWYPDGDDCSAARIADYLIANGISVVGKTPDGRIRICKHNDGYGWCSAYPGYCVVGPCSKEELVEYGPVQRWIPVTERLPKGENGKDLCDLVVVYTKDGEVTTGWLNGAYWWVICGESSRHTMRDRNFVTHWMPLPEPPTDMRRRENG